MVDGVYVEHDWWSDFGPEVTTDLTIEQSPENLEIVGPDVVTRRELNTRGPARVGPRWRLDILRE